LLHLRPESAVYAASPAFPDDWAIDAARKKAPAWVLQARGLPRFCAAANDKNMFAACCGA
jgi:hypothetical protein